MPLTKRQKQILDFLELFLTEYGYSPSYEEIARNFGYTSLATVHEHLENLEQKGYIRKSYNASRSIELMPASGSRASAVELPLLGLVAAGQPIEAIDDQ
jgi:repressor LexA